MPAPSHGDQGAGTHGAMRRLLLAASALASFPLLAAIAPLGSSSDVATVDVFVECKCVPALEVEMPMGDTVPFVVSWTRDDDNVDGICASSYCGTLFTPRPCDGGFKVSVGWAGTNLPVPPCMSDAEVSYQGENDYLAHLTGKLNLADVVVHERHVGSNLVDCAKKSENPPDGRKREEDKTMTKMIMSCATTGGLQYARAVMFREVCIGCDGPVNPN